MNLGYIWNRVIKKLRGRAIRNSEIDHTSKVESGSTVINSKMGRYSFCGYDCKINNCTIGSFCSIADNVVIGPAEHPISWASTSPVFYKGRDSVKKKFSKHQRIPDRRTYIGNDVWIGERTMIKAGVTVGDGAVVGMGSVVTKDVGPYEIWAGNPAKLIRKRFDEDIIERFVSLEWWIMPDGYIDKITENIKEPEMFVRKLEEIGE